MRLLIVLAAMALSACGASVTVRSPLCETPPLPLEVWVPCPPPQPIADGRMETLYLNSYIDTATIGCWADRMANIKRQIEYRDAQVKACQEQATKPKGWWQ